MEYFEVYLNSADAISGASTPHSCRFNLGSVYDFVPNAYKYAQSHCCYVKVKYFSVEETTANFNTAGTGTILVQLSGILPNSVTSQAISTSNNMNMGQSNIIGVIPTSIAKNSYCSNTFDNDYVKSNNIFNGDITINLKDQDDAFIALTGSKAWVMLISVAFDKDSEVKSHPNTGSTNYFSY